MARELAGASVSSAAELLGVSSAELARELDAAFRDNPIRAMPGATTVVRALDGRIPMAVATNGPARLVHYGLTEIGLADAFAAVVSADQVPHPKPAPDVYIAACLALNVDPSDAIAIEDSPAGARAASETGMIVVGVSSSAPATIRADLRVPRLDDPIVFRYLGVDPPRPRQAHLVRRPSAAADVRGPGTA